MWSGSLRPPMRSERGGGSEGGNAGCTRSVLGTGTARSSTAAIRSIAIRLPSAVRARGPEFTGADRQRSGDRCGPELRPGAD
eukprot:4839530-Alexandrium_andersonii.AAC.1